MIPASEKLRLLKMIKSPYFSEKSEYSTGASPQFVFEVASVAKKSDIEQAIQLIFKVEVEKVRVLNVKGKVKTFKQITGKRKNWKKAYVSLRPGYTIDLVKN